SSTARLHREGVDHVLGYHGPIVDVLSTRAEEALYGAIAAGHTTRFAVLKAREALQRPYTGGTEHRHLGGTADAGPPPVPVPPAPAAPLPARSRRASEPAAGGRHGRDRGPARAVVPRRRPAHARKGLHRPPQGAARHPQAAQRGRPAEQGLRLPGLRRPG